ncbi:MAG TPA: hypothetical protein VEC11_05160 [Allosphingosinicella sp.]|nr:hypothetical protein [Allosphingosinicella sp.]
MKLTAIAASIAVIAVPIAVQGAQAPTKTNPPPKRICTVQQTLGSRVNNVRSCRTREEREAAKQEARQTVDRVQAMKATTCPPNC